MREVRDWFYRGRFSRGLVSRWCQRVAVGDAVTDQAKAPAPGKFFELRNWRRPIFAIPTILAPVAGKGMSLSAMRKGWSRSAIHSWWSVLKNWFGFTSIPIAPVTCSLCLEFGTLSNVTIDNMVEQSSAMAGNEASGRMAVGAVSFRRLTEAPRRSVSVRWFLKRLGHRHCVCRYRPRA